jgi:Tfp pilus assembly protein PilO
MRDLTKKRLILIGLGVLFLLDGALLYFNSKLSAPENDRRQALVNQTHQLALVRADVDRATKIRAKIPEILHKFDDFEATLLPASKGYSVLLQELDDYARDTHVILEDNLYHSKDVAGHNLTEVHLDSSVTGDYNGIVQFLNHLQRSKNVYIVDSLAVDTGESGRNPGTLKVSLHMRTYFRKT